MWPFKQSELTVAVLCTANVCRSPAAAALLQHHLRQVGLGRRVAVVSAGTEVMAGGQAPDPRMVSLAKEQGIALRARGSRPMDDALLRGAAFIWVMEQRHIEAALQVAPDLTDRVALLDPAGEEVPDPYFGNKAGVRAVYERLDVLCAARARELAERLA